MFKPKWTLFAFLVISLMAIVPLVDAQEPTQSEREAMYYKYLNFASYVKGGSIQPHWMADGSSFWYAEGAPSNTVIYKIDPKANTKTPLFNTEQLRQALTPVLGHEPAYQGLPFDKFTFVGKGEKAVKFSVEDKQFILQLDTYTITRAPSLSEQERTRLMPQPGEVPSPDRRWFARIMDHNLWLRSTYDGRSVQLTTEGIEGYGWGFRWHNPPGIMASQPMWAPDGFKLAIVKVDSRHVPKFPIVHWLKPVEEVEWYRWPKAGGPSPKTELLILDILSKQQIRVDIGDEQDQYINILGWRPDASEMLFLRVDRLWKKLDLMAANPATGSTRVVVTETQKTFVGSHLNPNRGFTMLEDGKRFIWMSERDGWLHLYLYDMEGTLIRRLTKGAFPVFQVIAVDENASWVYFTAYGDPEGSGQRILDRHLYRINLKGRGFTRLTEATGRHAIQFSPSKELFLDTQSSVDRPPAVELRRADGKLLQILSKANIDALKEELKWSPPEEFVVKAADGRTDLYGILYKPYDFDPNKKYPVIEYIYAGPQVTVVLGTFSFRRGVYTQALAQLGFVTFIMDGRGAPRRGKEFQDVTYGNYGRHEIPDRVAALKQLAAKRPYMDLSRVGIWGYSWGGYNALRAMLLAPDVYHVGIAGDARSMRGGYSLVLERNLGLPQTNKEGYEYGSNLRLAGNLKGKLLLIIGTSAPRFSDTMKMVEAFIRAGKPYDLLVFPEQPHSRREWATVSLRYMQEAVRRYLQEHLKPELAK